MIFNQLNKNFKTECKNPNVAILMPISKCLRDNIFI